MYFYSMLSFPTKYAESINHVIYIEIDTHRQHSIKTSDYA